MLNQAFLVLGEIWNTLINLFGRLWLPDTPFNLLTLIFVPLILGLVLIYIHKLYDFGGVSK